MSADPEEMERRLRRTDIAQPAIGAVSAAMYRVLSRFGVVPDAVGGHSYGELVALHAAGWISADDLWSLSIQRGRLMSQAGQTAGESGSMMAVKAPVEEIESLVATLKGDVVLANRNSLDQGVLSGTNSGIEAAEAACRDRGWRTIRLSVAAAFHSHLVADAREPFATFVEPVELTPNQIRVMSNTLGGPYPAVSSEAKQILSDQLARPVDFLSNVESLYDTGIRTFVEIGPKTVLSQLVRSSLSQPDVQVMALDQYHYHNKK